MEICADIIPEPEHPINFVNGHGRLKLIYSPKG